MQMLASSSTSMKPGNAMQEAAGECNGVRPTASAEFEKETTSVQLDLIPLPELAHSVSGAAERSSKPADDEGQSLSGTCR